GEPRRVMVAEVVLDDGAGSRAGEIPPVLTGADGRFEVGGLRHGHYRVGAEGLRGGARGAVADVETGSDVTVKLVTLSVLRGTVTLGGAPVADYAVTVEGPTRKQQTVHAADGAFTMRGLDPGTYQVEAKAREASGAATATIEAGKEATVAIELHADGKVTGKVVDAAGAPMAGLMVIVTPRQAPGETMISLDEPPPQTGADGAFVVTSKAGPRTLLVLGPQGPAVRQDLDVEDGKTVDLGTLTAQAPGAEP
ncbi:MAG: carboxypeptidase regulatory-like domain-containing protein, partial [Myxococcales bacterium]|nr:carboxypeptidase regulatory-like domain-containing protein [Myxococcales bacterium]